MNRGDDQIAFILAIIIIHHDDDFAAFKRSDRIHDPLLIIRHTGTYTLPVCPRCIK